MLVIAQWYNCFITFFFFENKTKNPEKTTGTIFKFQYLKKGLHFREQFYSSSEQVSLQSYKVLDQKILEQRLLPKSTFTGSDLKNNHS